MKILPDIDLNGAVGWVVGRYFGHCEPRSGVAICASPPQIATIAKSAPSR